MRLFLILSLLLHSLLIFTFVTHSQNNQEQNSKNQQGQAGNGKDKNGGTGSGGDGNEEGIAGGGENGDYKSTNMEIVAPENKEPQVSLLTEEELEPIKEQMDLYDQKEAARKKRDERPCKEFFGGIGASLLPTIHDKGTIEIYEAVEGYPAHELGLEYGDLVMGTVRGEVGSLAELTIRKTDGREYTATVQRAKICLDDIQK